MTAKKIPTGMMQTLFEAAALAADVTRPTQPAPVSVVELAVASVDPPALPVVEAPPPDPLPPAPPADVPDLLPLYIDHMQAKGFVAKHIKHVVLNCRICEKVLGMPLAAMKKPDLRRYDAHLARRRMAEEIAADTVDKYQSAVHGFFKWAVRDDHLITVSSDGAFNKPKTGQRLPRSLNAKEFLALLEAASRGVYPHLPLYAPRDQAVIATLGFCGLRISEALGLDWADIKDGYLTVIGKGNKQRRVPVPAALVPFLDAWKAVHPHGGNGPVFTAGKKPHQRLPYDSDWRKHIKLLVTAAGIKPEVSSHWLRHTFAQTLLDSEKVPLDQIQKLLGHASIATTQTYARTRVTDSTVAAINDAFSG